MPSVTAAMCAPHTARLPGPHSEAAVVQTDHASLRSRDHGLTTYYYYGRAVFCRELDLPRRFDDATDHLQPADW